MSICVCVLQISYHSSYITSAYIESATEQMKIGCEQREFFYITYELRIFIYGLLLRRAHVFVTFFNIHYHIERLIRMESSIEAWLNGLERISMCLCLCMRIRNERAAWKDDITLHELDNIVFNEIPTVNWMESVQQRLWLLYLSRSFLLPHSIVFVQSSIFISARDDQV